MTSVLFQLWATSVFFLTIELGRGKHDSREKIRLPMHASGFHHIDKFLRDCTARDIKVIFLVPHTPDQIQPLDLLTSALMQQPSSATKFDGLANLQSNQVVRILGVGFAACSPYDSVEAFMNLGLIPEDPAGRFYLKVIPE